MAGFIGMALSYGLSLNVYVVFGVQNWCLLEDLISSVERLEEYMHIPGEDTGVIEGHQPMHNCPAVGKVKICDLKVNQKNAKKYYSIHQPVLELWKCIYYYLAHQSGQVSAQCSPSSSGDKLHI
jgi:hypothetical protein